MKNFSYLKTFVSPFKRPKFEFYLGKTAIGTPYFYPRRWVKATPELARKAAMREIQSVEDFNTRNAKNGSSQTVPDYDTAYARAMRCRYPVDKRIGIDFVELGWKTKWSPTDIRFEWAPRWSFVCFGYQIVVTFCAPEESHYWESWLYYELHTDKSKSRRERIAQCREKFPQVWVRHTTDGEEKTNYYDLILRKGY